MNHPAGPVHWHHLGPVDQDQDHVDLGPMVHAPTSPVAAGHVVLAGPRGVVLWPPTARVAWEDPSDQGCETVVVGPLVLSHLMSADHVHQDLVVLVVPPSD